MQLLREMAVVDLTAIIAKIDSDVRPMADNLISAGRAIAGIGALFYIAIRVWRSMVNAEPINFYPLFRPLSIGLVLVLYTPFISLLETAMRPLVTASEVMVSSSLTEKQKADNDFFAVDSYLSRLKSQSMMSVPPVDVIGDNGAPNVVGNDIKFNELKVSSRQFIYELLKVLYQAAPLVILTLRKFLLIILYIIGPISFGLSVWDGFRDTLVFWIKGYIVIFMWLPITNIFGVVISKFYAAMVPEIAADIIANGDAVLFPSDTSFMCLMIIAIMGYISVPFIANYMLKATGVNKKTT